MKRKVLMFTLALCLAASAQAIAQADLGFKRIGGALGYVSPEDFDGTFTFGVFADMGTIMPQLSLEPRLDFWSQSEEGLGTEVSVSDITFGVRGKYFFEVAHPTFRPFAGAGLAMHLLNAEISSPGFPTVDDSDTKFGLDFGGGVATAISPKADLHGELWYGIIEDFNQFSLRVGMSYRLGE